MNKTCLGKENEEDILKELSIIINKYCNKLNKNDKVIKESIIYLWEDEQKRIEKEWDDYLSAREIGRYGGR